MELARLKNSETRILSIPTVCVVVIGIRNERVSVERARTFGASTVRYVFVSRVDLRIYKRPRKSRNTYKRGSRERKLRWRLERTCVIKRIVKVI